MRRPSFLKQRRRLDTNVTFQRRSTTKNEFNEVEPTSWADLFTTRCAVYPAPGFERYESRSNGATAPVLCEVLSEKRTKALLPTDRMVVNGITYNLVAPIEQPQRGDRIRIIAAADLGG